MKIKAAKQTAVPSGGSITANTIYFVTTTDPDIIEIYVSNSAGTALRRILNETDIQALIDASGGGGSGVNEIEIVPTIADRDNLTLTVNSLVIVEDASSDSTVAAGAALYAYKQSTDTFSKLSEFESLDVVLNWSAIVGGPTSAPSAIDSAVTNSHVHANKTQLDLIGQDADDDMTYNGAKVANEWGSVDW